MSEELAIGLRETRNDIKQLLAGQATLAAQVNQVMQNQSTSIDVRTKQGEDLAVVKNVMIAFSKYQDKCEIDREELHKVRGEQISGYQRYMMYKREDDITPRIIFPCAWHVSSG